MWWSKKVIKVSEVGVKRNEEVLCVSRADEVIVTGFMPRIVVSSDYSHSIMIIRDDSLPSGTIKLIKHRGD